MKHLSQNLEVVAVDEDILIHFCQIRLSCKYFFFGKSILTLKNFLFLLIIYVDKNIVNAPRQGIFFPNKIVTRHIHKTAHLQLNGSLNN